MTELLPDCPQCGGNEPELIIVELDDGDVLVPICGLCGYSGDDDE